MRLGRGHWVLWCCLCCLWCVTVGGAEQVYTHPFDYQTEEVQYVGKATRGVNRVLIRSKLSIVQPGPELQLIGKETYYTVNMESFMIPNYIDNAFLEHVLLVKEQLTMASAFFQVGIQLCGGEPGYRRRMMTNAIDYFRTAQAMFQAGKNVRGAELTAEIIGLVRQAIPEPPSKVTPDYSAFYRVLNSLMEQTVVLAKDFDAEYKVVILEESNKVGYEQR
ncbi:MAG: hypothetical protein ACI3ZY_00320 [Parabacteroides sp.]